MDTGRLPHELMTAMSRASPNGSLDPFDGRGVGFRYRGRDLCASVTADISDDGMVEVRACPMWVLKPRLHFHGSLVSVRLDDEEVFHDGVEWDDAVAWKFECNRQGEAVRLAEGLAKIASDYFELEALGTRIAERISEVFPEATVATGERMVSLFFKGYYGESVRIQAELGDADDDRGSVAVYFGPADVFESFVTETSFVDGTLTLLGHQCHDRYVECEEIPYGCIGGFFGADGGGAFAFVEGLADIASQHFFVRS